MQQGNVSKVAPRAPLAAAHCEVLFELFSGRSGSVQLGRLLRGTDTGRLVVLRSVNGLPSPDLESAVDVARSIAHPKLVKVLGLIADRDSHFVASEFIVGVTLFELVEHVCRRGVPLDFRVAAKVVIDALAAAQEAQRLLLTTAKLEGVRSVFPESLWIAEYGEVFAAETLVMAMLEDEENGDTAVRSASHAAISDVRAAAEVLRDLLSGGPEPAANDGSSAPRQLTQLLARALGPDGATDFETIEQFSRALAGIDRASIASEAEVGQELKRLMGAVWERRQQRLELMQSETEEPLRTEPDATRVFRVASVQLPVESVRPFEEATVVFRSVAPRSVPPRSAFPRSTAPRSVPTVPAHVEIQTLDVGDVPSPISAVWREARAVLAAPNRRLRPAAARVEAEPTPVHEEAPPEPLFTPRGTRIARIVLLLALTVGAAVAACSLFGIMQPQAKTPAKPGTGSATTAQSRP